MTYEPFIRAVDVKRGDEIVANLDSEQEPKVYRPRQGVIRLAEHVMVGNVIDAVHLVIDLEGGGTFDGEGPPTLPVVLLDNRARFVSVRSTTPPPAVTRAV